MKLLFIENRQQTYFWAEIARRLLARGHDVAWIVQNHTFGPEAHSGTVHRIPYPRSRSRKPTTQLSRDLRRIARSDRYINHFGGGAAHYAHYVGFIEKVLEEEKPDVAFGESTLFHELICGLTCRRLGIPYLQPTSCRYPVGRFSFFLYDTLEPYAGSGDKFSPQALANMIERIAKRSTLPDYMSPVRHSFWQELFKNLTMTLSYWSGERFNTPSPLRKFVLERSVTARKREWDEIATNVEDLQGVQLLYPLQMQPESTIDVWGCEFRDQVALLNSLLEALDENVSIVIKPNPKSKYEMSGELVQLVKNSPRLKALPHSTTMQSAWERAALILTVTGTVAIEAVMAGKPVATLVRTFLNDVKGCPFISSVNEIQSLVAQVRLGEFPRPTTEDQAQLLGRLAATSYAGIISNPFHMPASVHPENLQQVLKAFVHVLEVVQADATARPGSCLRLGRAVENVPKDKVLTGA